MTRHREVDGGAELARVAMLTRYVSQGMHLVACEPGGKRPWVAYSPHGVQSATRDLDQILSWPREANVAVAAAPSGLVIVDLDPRNGGRETMLALRRTHGRLSPSWWQRTGGGGTHALYRAPADVELRGHLGRGVDLIANGYAVVAPSVTAAPYVMHTDYPLADLPAWIVDLAPVVEEPPPPPRERRADDGNVVERARRWLTKCEPAIMGSHGSAALMHAASGLVRGFGLDDADVIYLLWLEYNPRCEPPWRKHEVLRAVQNAKRSPKPLGYLLDAPRRCA